MTNNFILNVTNDYFPEVEDNIKESLFSQYERVIIESLLTSFGLDMLLIKDQHGGEVDTIHNVRKIGLDEQMKYKNLKNERTYSTLEKYDNKAYHKNTNFERVKHEVRTQFQEDFKPIKDEYTEKNIGFYGHTKAVSPNKKAELDHILGASEIHQDRGRILAELSGIELANSNENFAWTNKSLNASMGAWSKKVNEEYRKKYGCDAPMEKIDMKAYVNAHPELDETTKKNMLSHYEKAKKEYDRKLNIAYYNSTKFKTDLLISSTKVGIKMGLRQALGLVFTEIWFTIKEEYNKLINVSFTEFLNAVGNGIKNGFKNAIKKYKDLIEKFKGGVIAGVLSNLTTTICNIFFTTAKNTVKIIRELWATIVESLKILFLNPDNLQFGERMRAVLKLVATGASVVVGTMVSDAVGKFPSLLNHELGNIIKTFLGTLVTGFMSCSLLYLLEENIFINKLVKFLDELPTMNNLINSYKQQVKYLEEYAAKLMNIDLETLKKEIIKINNVVSKLEIAKTPEETHKVLKEIYIDLNLETPWKGDFDKDFMSDKSAVLVFK